MRSGIAVVMVLTLALANQSPIGATDAPTPAPLPTVRTADGREAAPDRIVVGFQPGVTAAEQDAVHRAVAGRSALAAAPAPKPTGRVADDVQIVDVTGAGSLEAAAAAYRADPRVRYAEPDYLVRTAEAPNDPNFAQQYDMAIIGAPAAWSITHGSAGVKIAILDCGIAESHPDLAGKVAARQDFTGSPYGTDDRCNHGTHVAGIAAAGTGNGVGVAGVGYDTALLNGKVLGDGGTGYDTQIAAGIRWAADSGAKVINMSLGGPGACAQTFQDAITYAWSKQVVVIVAAGNNGSSTSVQPANCAHVVAVASTDAADARSSFSNYGAWVAVAAPGSSILSAVNPAINGGSLYDYKSGTSMATPHVAGLAGLIWATSFGTNAAAVVARLESTTDAIAGTGTSWQYGRINAAVAVGGGLPIVTALDTTSVIAGTPSLTLTVTGDNFKTGASLLWNGSPRVTTVTGGTQLVGMITQLDLLNPGTASVTVKNPDGRVSARALTLTIGAPPPQITDISPASGSTTGGATVTVHGTHFQSGATVTFGGTRVTVTAATATSLTVTTPAHTAGSVDIAVSNPDGQTDTLPGAYTYIVPPPTQRPSAAVSGGAPAPNPQSRSANASVPNAGAGQPAPAPVPTAR